MKGPLLLVLLALFGSSAPPVAAQEPWADRPFAVDARTLLAAAQSVPAPAGAGVVVLFRDAAYDFDAAGRTTYRQRLVYRLLTREGVEGWSASEVDYAPWHQQRPEIRARVVTPDGGEHWLEAAALADRPAASDSPDVVADRRVVEAPLGAVRVGAVVEEEIVVRDTEPFFAAGTAGTYPLAIFAPILRGRLRFTAPVTLPLRYGVRRMPGLEPRQRFADGRVELTFEYRDQPAIEALETGLPSHLPRIAQVAYSTGESWQAVAAGYSRLVDEKIAGSRLEAILRRLSPDAEKPDAEKPDAEGPDAGPPKSRIARILAELRREVRYTGLELGASSLIPAAPDVTLERGFGDCKDQATLLVALLRHEGIPAHVALLNAGFGKDVDTALPGFGRFNHAVVYVPAARPIWIDPTDPAARAGELPASDQNRWALVARPDTEKLLRTPVANSVDNLTVERREVFLADRGSGRVVERSVYRGEQERQQRRASAASSEDSRRQGYFEYVESTYLAEELGQVEESDPDDLSQPFTLVLEALGANRAMTDLSEAVVAIRQESLLAGLPPVLRQDGPTRRQPFVTDQPFVTEWKYRIVPPAGFVPRALPGDEERRFGPARYTRTVRQEDGEVHLAARFDSGPRFLTPAQFEQMRQGVRQFLAEEPLVVWFDHVGAAALATGHSREAIGHFRRLAELEPDATIHQIRLAQALLQIGVGREGERRARSATELDPGSALAWWSLGLAAEHDEVGRRFGPGYDREAALAALEKAVALDPDDPLPRTELAILLEYDADGRRYSNRADLDRAIAQYRLLRDDLAATNLDVNLISALYWAERWQELYAATLAVDPSRTSRYLHLVALAVLEDPEATIRESESLSATPEEQVDLLNAAVQHLVIARRYLPAAALLSHVAREATRPEPLLRRAVALGRTRRHEELEVATDTPAALARSLLLTLGRRQLDRAALSQLFHPQYVADRGTAETGLEAAFARIRQEQLRSAGDLPAEAVLDLAMGILEPAVDGDDARGHRVRLLNEIDGTSVAFRLYVTRHEGRPVIAAVEDEYGQIGKEVWRRLELDDLRGAHQWLDWTRDALTPVDTDDPYGFRPFARFWTRGTGAFRDKMHLAAAILMADQPEAAAAVPVLEQALRSADDATRRVVEAALFRAYSRLEDGHKLAALSARLLEREPTSALAFAGRCEPLLGERRFAELERLAKERLRLMPGNAEALRVLARSAAMSADAERAIAFYEKLREAGKLAVEDLNRWSWLLLFREAVPAEALELAQQGAALSKYRERPMLHTLAAAYAMLGRPGEAYQALRQSLELEEDRRLESDDWLVVGRIVEEYGFPDLAREYYERVEAAPGGEAYSTFALAQRLLKTLDRDRKRRAETR